MTATISDGPAGVEHVTPSSPAPGTLTLIVTGISQPAPDIKMFTLARPDGGPLPGFVAGSHLVVHTGVGANAYSLTGDGLHPSAYTFSVLRVIDGRGGSRWLHDSVKPGDTLEIAPPRSAFPPIARAAKHLLIAGGIGVTPIVSHLRAARRWGRNIQVLYVFRNGNAAHIDDVTELAGRSAELYTDRESFLARLTAELSTQPVGTHLYVCGPAAMIDVVVAAAATAGWPESRVHFERFGIDALDAGDPFRVTLTESDTTIDVPSGTSMLEALEDNGIDVPNLCRQGVCGECRLPLSGGTPIHRDLYLSDEEKTCGDAIMPCVSRAAEGATLELPL